MAASLVFPMSNNFYQKTNQNDVSYKALGICTCISLNWARQTLKKQRGLKSYSEIGLAEHTMNAQMAMLRKYDHDPVKQSSMCDLQPIGGDQHVSSIDEVINITKQNAPYISIFWTNTHTMGYRYGHLEKEFFDNEVGLYRAKKTDDIKKVMSDTISGYGAVEGMRLLRLM